jgi:hypothetical protein
MCLSGVCDQDPVDFLEILSLLLQFYLCQDYEMVEHVSPALSYIYYENQTYLTLHLERL